MVDEICIPRERTLVEHLVLIADIHIEVLVKRLVDAEEKPVLVESGLRPLTLN